MKKQANSDRRLRLSGAVAGLTLNSQLVSIAVADVATIQFRTRILSLSAKIHTVEALTGNVEFVPPYAMILSKKDYLALVPESTFEDALAVAVYAVAIDVGRNFSALSDDSLAYSSAYVGMDYDVVIPFTELEQTLCGTEFYLVTLGGVFNGVINSTIVYDRVEMTDAELKTFMVC